LCRRGVSWTTCWPPRRVAVGLPSYATTYSTEDAPSWRLRGEKCGGLGRGTLVPAFSPHDGHRRMGAMGTRGSNCVVMFATPSHVTVESGTIGSFVTLSHWSQISQKWRSIGREKHKTALRQAVRRCLRSPSGRGHVVHVANSSSATG
jgi:hypothetical protein